MRVLIIQHDHVSPPGPVGERFADRGFDVELNVVVPAESFARPGVGPRFPDPTAFDAVVAMGAPWSSYDLELVGSWVTPELELLRRADRAGVPVLGICFGGQLLATAHGGSVVRSDRPELGWSTVHSDDEEIVPSGRWFQWHYDRWQLPAPAREIARNPNASQAFVLRRNLAVQFHPELTSASLAGWLGNGGEAAVLAFGLDPQRLLAETRERDAQAAARAHRLVDGFLDVVAQPDGPRGQGHASGAIPARRS
jgi:GMP synthase-like glutamine amidotransferase